MSARDQRPVGGVLTPYHQTAAVTLYQGDALDVLRCLPDESVHCVVTSPPYFGVRDYGVAGAYGLESTPQELVDKLVTVFADVRRVLRADGVFWLNVGDSYASSMEQGRATPAQSGKHAYLGEQPNQARTDLAASGLKRKDLIGFSWLLAFALQADGWWLRSECIWHKSNAMPSSALDRPTVAHERVFLLSKCERYFYDTEAVRTPAKRPYVMKEPTGWDSDEGGHGTIHRNGRGRKDKQRGHVRVHAGFNDRWDHLSHSEQRAMGANLRSVWEIPTQGYPGEHYATFPERLAETCILAGTSAHGVCPSCEAPWKRLVAVGYANPGNRATNGQRSIDHKHSISAGFAQRMERESRTVGWQPSCTCDAGAPVPATVLDPFVGSGTSCRVAQWLGRKSIGIDLSAAYLDMTIERTAQQALWFGTEAAP